MLNLPPQFAKPTNSRTWRRAEATKTRENMLTRLIGPEWDVVAEEGASGGMMALAEMKQAMAEMDDIKDKAYDVEDKKKKAKESGNNSSAELDNLYRVHNRKQGAPCLNKGSPNPPVHFLPPPLLPHIHTMQPGHCTPDIMLFSLL